MMLSESELGELVMDMSMDISRRLGGLPLLQPDMMYMGMEFQKSKTVLSETRLKSRERITMLDESIYGNMVVALFQELIRRFPDLKKEDDENNSKNASEEIAMKDGALVCLESMISQWYPALESNSSLNADEKKIMDSSLFQATQAHLQNASSSINSSSTGSLADVHEKCMQLERELLDRQLVIQELQVQLKNVSFSRDSLAEKSQSLEDLLKTLQGKFDELHQDQLTLVESKRDNEALITTLGTKVRQIYLFTLC